MSTTYDLDNRWREFHEREYRERTEKLRTRKPDIKAAKPATTARASTLASRGPQTMRAPNTRHFLRINLFEKLKPAVPPLSSAEKMQQARTHRAAEHLRHVHARR